ncbi:hypothetical protein SCG7086_BA_00060 [Chlamydiales bacterium SCGC AG-110-P3]|nr:hypothetical protein SCG7086_BA_00060 [Chlamydiales bacterium SCGC AG-110-P3]
MDAPASSSTLRIPHEETDYDTDETAPNSFHNPSIGCTNSIAELKQRVRILEEHRIQYAQAENNHLDQLAIQHITNQRIQHRIQELITTCNQLMGNI